MSAANDAWIIGPMMPTLTLALAITAKTPGVSKTLGVWSIHVCAARDIHDIDDVDDVDDVDDINDSCSA